MLFDQKRKKHSLTKVCGQCHQNGVVGQSWGFAVWPGCKKAEIQGQTLCLGRLGQSQVVIQRGSQILGTCSLQMGSEPPRGMVGWIIYSVHHAVPSGV